MSVSKGDLKVMGNIHIVDDPASEGASRMPYGVPLALVIQFETREALKSAIDAGRCEFTILGREPERRGFQGNCDE